MALCGNCGTSEKDVKPDENGMCGKCGEDNWAEWNDFKEEDLKSLMRYVIAKQLKLSMPELVWEVFESETVNKRIAIKNIFEEFKL
jgi:hypothetical protein